jgi:hypothetical protein
MGCRLRPKLDDSRALEGDLLSEFEKKLKAIDLQRRALSEGQLLQATIPVIGIRSN